MVSYDVNSISVTISGHETNKLIVAHIGIPWISDVFGDVIIFYHTGLARFMRPFVVAIEAVPVVIRT